MTWPCLLEVNDENIRGTIPELAALRDEIAEQLQKTSVGQSFIIDRKFRKDITTTLVFNAKAADFAPASLDMYITSA